MNYRGLFIADIHIGALSYTDTYDGIMYIKDQLKEITKEVFDGNIHYITGDFCAYLNTKI